MDDQQIFREFESTLAEFKRFLGGNDELHSRAARQADFAVCF